MRRRFRRRRVAYNRNPTTIPTNKIVKLVAAAIGILILIKIILLGISYGPLLFQFIFNRGIDLATTNGKVNVLILGTGGANHDGPNLSDTIIFASIDPKTSKVIMLSIPRDLWVPEMHGKINTAYAVGEAQMKGGGLVLAKAMLGKVTGQQINYGVRIDFDGFVKAVNLVGGLDINVENTFDDYQYPIDGKENATCGLSPEKIQEAASSSAEPQTIFPCRYIHIHFNKGEQHMDGATALEYVRSRHGTGSEGSDFARSKRQQKVISAFKSKLFSAGTILNPARLLSLYSVLKSSIDTDVPQDKFDDFFRLAQKVGKAKIQNYALDEGDVSNNRAGLLTNPTTNLEQYGYAWVLIPRTGNGNYAEINNYVNCIEVKTNCTVSQNPQ